MLAQRRAVLLGQGRHIRPGRADSERERLPPLLEGGVPHPDSQGRGPRLTEASLREERDQLAFPDPGPARFVRCQRIQVTRRTPEQGQRAAAAGGVVPHTRRDRPAGTGDPAHLAQASYWIGHEMDDQLRQRDIKGAVSERQLLGRRPPDIDSRQPLPRRAGERPGRFHGAHRARPSRLTSSAVSTPGPQPTSSARWPLATPARSANSTASGSEYLPMNRI